MRYDRYVPHPAKSSYLCVQIDIRPIGRCPIQLSKDGHFHRPSALSPPSSPASSTPRFALRGLTSTTTRERGTGSVEAGPCPAFDRTNWTLSGSVRNVQSRLLHFSLIEGWYNSAHRYSGIGYLSPIAYEEKATIQIETTKATNRLQNRGNLNSPAAASPRSTSRRRSHWGDLGVRSRGHGPNAGRANPAGIR